MSVIVSVNDWVPRYRDGGYTALIESLALTFSNDTEFLYSLNADGGLPRLNWSMFLQFYADLRADSELLTVELNGETNIPSAIARAAAPSGLGQDASGVWFNAPDTGTRTIRWYVNGALKVSGQFDCTVNRSVYKSALACQVGDVVQVCEVVGNVVGWWGRIIAS